MKKFEKEAKIVIAGREHYDDDQESKYITFKLWEKGGNRRIYINDYKRRTFGYIDIATGEYTELETNGLKADQIAAAIEAFKAEYEF